MHEGALNQRARQARLGGGGGNGNGNRRGPNGKAAAAEVAARLGKSTDIMKSGATKGETTCKFEAHSCRTGSACCGNQIECGSGSEQEFQREI
eukprot:3128076-Pyramimonas_sp.AAC.1